MTFDHKSLTNVTSELFASIKTAYYQIRVYVCIYTYQQAEIQDTMTTIQKGNVKQTYHKYLPQNFQMLIQNGGSFVSVVLGVLDKKVCKTIYKCLMLLTVKALIL